MPVFTLPSGRTATFPDDTPPEEMQDAMDDIYAQDTMSPLSRGLFGVTKHLMGLAEPEPRLKLPVIKGNSFGMTTASGEAVRNTLQQSNEADFAQKLQARAAREKALEAEQDRAQQFKLENMRFKNDANMRQMEIDAAMERARFAADVDASKLVETPWGMYDPATKQIVPGSEPPADPNEALRGKLLEAQIAATSARAAYGGGGGGGGGGTAPDARVFASTSVAALPDGSFGLIQRSWNGATSWVTTPGGNKPMSFPTKLEAEKFNGQMMAFNPYGGTAAPVTGPGGQPLPPETPTSDPIAVARLRMDLARARAETDPEDAEAMANIRAIEAMLPAPSPANMPTPAAAGGVPQKVVIGGIEYTVVD